MRPVPNGAYQLAVSKARGIYAASRTTRIEQRISGAPAVRLSWRCLTNRLISDSIPQVSINQESFTYEAAMVSAGGSFLSLSAIQHRRRNGKRDGFLLLLEVPARC